MYRQMAESGRVPGKGKIRASIEKQSRLIPEKGRICVSTENWWNPSEYGDKVEFVRASIKLSQRVPEKGRIYVFTEKWQNPSEYREKERSLRVSKNCPDEY